MSLSNYITQALTFIHEHKSSILTCVTVGGVCATAFLTGKATLEADEYLRENVDPEILDIMPVKDKARLTWTYYIPPVAVGAVTISSAIMAQRINLSDLSSLAILASDAQRRLVDNREAVKESFGENGLRKIDENLNRRNLKRYVISTSATVYETGHGHMLCCEGYMTGILFRASPEWVYRAVNKINEKLINGDPVAFSEFILELIPGIHPKLIPEKCDLDGFDLAKRNELMEIKCDSFLLDTNETVMIFTQVNPPLQDYLYYK